MTKISEHFEKKDFTCFCCGIFNVNLNFLEKLEKARKIADIAFIVNSGYRCQIHNRKVGGDTVSSHMAGLAADLHIKTSWHRWKIHEALIKAGFKRIGHGSDFLHVDNDDSKPQEVFWIYNY